MRTLQTYKVRPIRFSKPYRSRIGLAHCICPFPFLGVMLFVNLLLVFLFRLVKFLVVYARQHSPVDT